jgi:hypothetical protein
MEHSTSMTNLRVSRLKLVVHSREIFIRGQEGQVGQNKDFIYFTRNEPLIFTPPIVIGL